MIPRQARAVAISIRVRRYLSSTCISAVSRQEGDRELDDLEPMLLERRDQVERRRAKLSGGALRTFIIWTFRIRLLAPRTRISKVSVLAGLMRSDYEAEVTSLPRRRREAIEGARRRCAPARIEPSGPEGQGH